VMLSLPIDDRYNTRDSRRVAAGRPPSSHSSPRFAASRAANLVPNRRRRPFTPPTTSLSPAKTTAAVAVIAH
jgi:hypothetical protein